MSLAQGCKQLEMDVYAFVKHILQHHVVYHRLVFRIGASRSRHFLVCCRGYIIVI